jgi:hypothetical protein
MAFQPLSQIASHDVAFLFLSGAIGGIESPKGEAVSSLILQLIALPGYLFVISHCDVFGLKRIQEFGFAAISFLFILLAILQPWLIKVLISTTSRIT